MDAPVQVSIICNVYNHGEYIRDALEGFVMQKTNFPFEVLVHDDASTDNSAQIIREYEEKYPDIIKPIYQTVNQYSLKTGITRTFQRPRAKGNYVAMCEGDDCWTDPLKLQKQFDFMESHPEYSLCVCSTVWHNVATNVHEDRGAIEEDRDIPLEEIILEKNGRIFQYATVFLRMDVWKNEPAWFRCFPIGDYPLALHAALHGKVRMLADTMAIYRYGTKNSWTVRMDNDKKRIQVCERMIEGLTAFNEATEGRYDGCVATRINRHKYTMALMNHDLKALRSGELGELFRARSLKYRVNDVIRCKFPTLYNALGKPLAKVMKSHERS